jgi:cytochrome c-type biogenesis protein CcmE
MTRKRRRLYGVLAGLSALGVGAALVLTAFQDNLVFFYSPSDILTKQVPTERRIRIGGLVEPQSVVRNGLTTEFRVTDTVNALKVTYTGLLPDLFREGQGVVANGRLTAGGTFAADEVLAKHDEKYMPPEVAAALKQAGQWKPEEKAAR